MAVIDLKEATVEIQDGGANTVELVLGDGNFTFTETHNREYRLNRGTLNSVKNGDDEPISLSFDMEWEYLSGDGSDPSPYEALKQTGDAAAWVSSDTTDPCAPYAVNIVVTYTPACGSGHDQEVITFPDFRVENINGDLSSSQLSADGRCNATEPTAVRSTIP